MYKIAKINGNLGIVDKQNRFIYSLPNFLRVTHRNDLTILLNSVVDNQIPIEIVVDFEKNCAKK